MKPELPLKSGDEYDALTKWKKFCLWKAGDRAAIKRGYNKRVRREVKKQVIKQLSE